MKNWLASWSNSWIHVFWQVGLWDAFTIGQLVGLKNWMNWFVVRLFGGLYVGLNGFSVYRMVGWKVG